MGRVVLTVGDCDVVSFNLGDDCSELEFPDTTDSLDAVVGAFVAVVCNGDLDGFDMMITVGWSGEYC